MWKACFQAYFILPSYETATTIGSLNCCNISNLHTKCHVGFNARKSTLETLFKWLPQSEKRRLKDRSNERCKPVDNLFNISKPTTVSKHFLTNDPILLTTLHLFQLFSLAWPPVGVGKETADFSDYNPTKVWHYLGITLSWYLSTNYSLHILTTPNPVFYHFPKICNTLFSFYKNVVFPVQAEYSCFSRPILGWKYSCIILKLQLLTFLF